MSDAAPLLAILERIAKALEERNVMDRRDTMQAGGKPLRHYGEQPQTESQNDKTRPLRRPRQGAHS